MRVARYYTNKDIRIEEMDVPKVGDRELLVRVQASGICGSDVMEWYRIKKAPLVLGHEIAGDILQTGKDVKKFKVGQRVFVSHHVPCNTCAYCLNGHHSVCDTLRTTNFDPGGFSEFIRVPELNVESGTFVLPEGMSYEEGTFIEPLACVVRGQRQAGMKAGKSVLVIGSGITGLLHVQLARTTGADKIFAVDINPKRLKAAKKLGADETISASENVPEKLLQLNGGRLAELVIVCTGAPSAISQAWNCADRGSTVLLFAPPAPNASIPFPLNALWFNEVTILTSYAGSPIDIAAAIDLLSAKRVRVCDMITHTLPLSETARGFLLVAQAQDSIKVIIEPQK